MRFSVSIQFDIPKLIKYANFHSPHSTQMTHFQVIHLHKMIFLHHNVIHYQILPFKTTLLLMIKDFNQLQKSINLIFRIEHVIFLKMTYRSLINPVTDKLKPIIIRDDNPAKTIDSSYHNLNFLTPEQLLENQTLNKNLKKLLSWILHPKLLLLLRVYLNLLLIHKHL